MGFKERVFVYVISMFFFWSEHNVIITGSVLDGVGMARRCASQTRFVLGFLLFFNSLANGNTVKKTDFSALKKILNIELDFLPVNNHFGYVRV